MTPAVKAFIIIIIIQCDDAKLIDCYVKMHKSPDSSVQYYS
jgi:hypothetical protein